MFFPHKIFLDETYSLYGRYGDERPEKVDPNNWVYLNVVLSS